MGPQSNSLISDYYLTNVWSLSKCFLQNGRLSGLACHVNTGERDPDHTTPRKYRFGVVNNLNPIDLALLEDQAHLDLNHDTTIYCLSKFDTKNAMFFDMQ